MNALVPVAPQSLSDHSGATLYRVSTDAAALCRDIVLATSVNIQGRKYVNVEGWMAVALAHGCAASSGDVFRHEDGSISATGKVIRIDTGTLISSAEGYVGADEQTWFGGKNAYGKMLPKRADYAIRAMAQTRAISRACRSAFAHVVVMMNVGLSTTPAEEVPEEGFDRSPPSPAPKTNGNGAKGRSVMDRIDSIRAELATATNEIEVRTIGGSPRVITALNWLREQGDAQKGALAELDAVLAEAYARFHEAHDPDTGEVTEPEFPGDR
jgi:hypothetical protein